MDIISHGLWGGLAFGRQNKKLFWQAFFFGIAPDALSFGIYFVLIFLGGVPRPPFWSGHPTTDEQIPQFVHTFYHFTHSLIIFALLFFILWLIVRRPVWTSLAWPLHIIFDIFTHSDKFFPTPFLWPVSDFHVSGINWTSPVIFIPNLLLLVVLYAWFFLWRRRSFGRGGDFGSEV